MYSAERIKPMLNMVLVDSDDRYIEKIAMKFVSEWGNSINLEIITNEIFYQQYISTPRNIDVLVIDEGLINANLAKQNIKQILVLSESKTGKLDGDYTKVEKYTDLQEVYYELASKIKNVFGDIVDQGHHKSTNIIMVYSAFGGAGKTTTAMALCMELVNLDKRVLYINLESVQNFQSFLTDKTFLTNGLEKSFAINNESISDYLEGAKGYEVFDYIKPIRYSSLSYGINAEDQVKMLKILKESKKYDFIIVDVSSELNHLNSAVMKFSSKILFILEQNYMSVFKTERLLENLDYKNDDKLMFICNKYKADEINEINKSSTLSGCKITEYIPFVSEQSINNLYDLNTKHLLRSTAYLML